MATRETLLARIIPALKQEHLRGWIAIALAVFSLSASLSNCLSVKRAANAEVENALNDAMRSLNPSGVLGRSIHLTRDRARIMDAKAYVDKAEKIGANAGVIYEYRALISLAKGKLERAIEDARKSVDRGNHDALLTLGRALLEANDVKSAIETYNKARKNGLNKADVAAGLSACYQHNGELGKAILLADQATKISKRNPMHWYRLGMLKLLAKAPYSALESGRKSIEFGLSDVANGLELIGYARMGLREYSLASLCLRRASDLYRASGRFGDVQRVEEKLNELPAEGGFDDIAENLGACEQMAPIRRAAF